MLRRGPDDETADRLLSGEALPGFEVVAAFVADARRVATPTPTPTVTLARVLSEGLRPVHVTEDITPTAPTRKKPRMLVETVLAKLAAAGLVAKTGLAAGAITLSATAAGATGHLPVVQDEVADAVATMGVDLPGGKAAAARAAIDGSEPGSGRGRAVSDAVKSDRAGERAPDGHGRGAETESRPAVDTGRPADPRADRPAGRPATGGPGAVETPAGGGSSTAADASNGGSAEGTTTAGERTAAADADAGAANADAGAANAEDAPVPAPAPAPAAPAAAATEPPVSPRSAPVAPAPSATDRRP